MTKLAAIEGQLVSIKNVSTHKSACLTIHVPEEDALKVIEAFGWPTMVRPVRVGIARLGAPEKEPEAQPAPETRTDKAKRKWDELSIAQRAGINCDEGGFKTFLREEYKDEWEISNGDAASVVHHLCMVASRSELNHNHLAGKRFDELDSEYRAWLRVPV